MVIALLQQAAAVAVTQPPAPGLTLGEWLAIVSALATLGGLLYRSGVSAAEMKNTKSTVTEKLGEVVGKLDKIGAFIDSTQLLRMEHAGWRATTDGRIETLEGSVDHVRTVAQEARALAEAVDRRVGVPDRRGP